MSSINNTSTGTLIILSTHRKLRGVIVERADPVCGDQGALTRGKEKAKKRPGVRPFISLFFFLKKRENGLWHCG